MCGSTGLTLGSFSIVSSTTRFVRWLSHTGFEAFADVEDVRGTTDLLYLSRLLLKKLDEGLIELLKLACDRALGLLASMRRGNTP